MGHCKSGLLSSSVASIYLNSASNFDLNHYTSVDEDALAILCNCNKWLQLDGLSEISVANAICLASFKGAFLYLNGIKNFSLKVIREIIKYKGGLAIHGLQSLNPETAFELSQFKGKWISLKGISKLGEENAKHFANYAAEKLFLDGIVNLSDQEAFYLSRCKTEWLSLNGLVDLTNIAAEYFVNFKGDLCFGSIEYLPDELAFVLANFSGRTLSFPFLSVISDNALGYLSRIDTDALVLPNFLKDRI